MKRSPIKRHPKRDPVTPELYAAVMARDHGCMAARIEFTRAWNSPDVDRDLVLTGNAYIPVPQCSGRLTLDHVQDGYGRMGKRAPSDMDHLVVLCLHHHLDGWATSHRPELRAYLAAVNV